MEIAEVAKEREAVVSTLSASVTEFLPCGIYETMLRLTHSSDSPRMRSMRPPSASATAWMRVLPGLDFYRQRWDEKAFGPAELKLAAERSGQNAENLTAIIMGQRGVPMRVLLTA